MARGTKRQRSEIRNRRTQHQKKKQKNPKETENTSPSLWNAPSRSWLDRTLAPRVPGSLGPWQAWQAWRLSLIFTGYFRAACWAVPSPPVPEPGPSWRALWKMTTAGCRLQITDYTVARGQRPREACCCCCYVRYKIARQPALAGHAIMPCRAMPRHASSPAAQPAASSERPAASSARHTTRSRELGPTILACPLVKIQERALQGKLKLGWPWHGTARAPDKLLRVPAYPIRTALVRWTSTCDPSPPAHHWKAPCR